MLYSPNIMAHFPIKVLPISDRGSKVITQTPFFHFNGTITTLAPLMLQAYESTPRMRAIVEEPFRDAQWCGMRYGETVQSMLGGLKCETALDDFQKAEAELHTPMLRDRPQLSVIGSSFSMGRVMQGHPVQCFRRPKRKLPIKNINITLSPHAGTDADLISKALAKVAKACMEYKLQGGSITLTLNYISSFAEPNPETKAQGVCLSLLIPIGDGNLTSLSSSIQFSRKIRIPFIRMLSGDNSASPLNVRLAKPDTVNFFGRLQDLDAVYKSLQIE